MSDIREKIMAIEIPTTIIPFEDITLCDKVHRFACNAAVDIAEAEVHRLEAKISRLQKLVSDNCGPDNC